jgi:hypothetical protein
MLTERKSRHAVHLAETLLSALKDKSVMGASCSSSRRPSKGQIIESMNYAHENGTDKKEIREWKWPL